MSGGGKRVTVGYRYYLGFALGLIHGIADMCLSIRVDKKTAIQPYQESGDIYINQPNLFGGEKREGGVQGTVSIYNGKQSQTRDTYMTSRLGSTYPAHRGICYAVFRQPYIGINPYPRKWSLVYTRISYLSDGSRQWYPSKCELPFGDIILDTLLFDENDITYKYIRIRYNSGAETEADTSDYSAINYDDSSWATGSGSIKSPLDAASPSFPTWATGGISYTPSSVCAVIWIRFTVTLTRNSRIVIACNDYADVYVNGIYLDRATLVATSGDSLLIPMAYLVEGSNQISIKGYGLGGFDFLGFRIYKTLYQSYDTNPAHIIRECLTDKAWGLSQDESMIDNETFEVAADTLYSEEFGLSFLWAAETSIYEFIKMVLSHIEGTLYVDRGTGKWKLTLARDDYDVEDLLVLDESNIVSIVNFKTKDPSELVNQVTVIFHDVEKGEQNSVTVQNRASIEQYGFVRHETYQFLGISRPELAFKVAHRELKSTSIELFTCTLYADRTAHVLNVGDVFVLNYQFKLQSGTFDIENMVMRVANIEYGTISDNKIKIDCIQDVFKTSAVTFVDDTGGEGGWENPQIEPSDIPNPLLFEAPYYELAQVLSDSEAQALDEDLGYAMITALEPENGYFNMTIYSQVGGEYEERGIAYFSPTATIASAITMNSKSVVIENVVDVNVVSIGTYAMIGTSNATVEIVRVESIVQDSLTGIWTLTFERGCLDTTRRIHASGTRIYFVDEFVGSDEIAYLAGETPNFKLIPTTSLGDLPIEDATVRTLTFASRKDKPYPPAQVKINGVLYPTGSVGEDVTFTWVERNRLQQTANIIHDEEDGIPAEIGTLYNFEIYQSNIDGSTLGSLLYSSYNIPASSDGTHEVVMVDSDFAGHTSYTCLVLWSERDVYESFQKHKIVFLR